MNTDMYKKISKILDKKQKIKIVFLLIAMFIGAFFESFSISLVLPLIEAIEETQNWNNSIFSNIICSLFDINNQRQYVVTLLVLLIVLFVIKNVYLIVEKYIQNSFIYNSRIELQKKLFSIYMNKNYEFFINSNSYDIARIIDSDASEVYMLISNVLAFFTDLIICIILAITLIIVSPLMSSLLMVFLLIEVLVLSKILRPYMNRLGEEYISYYTQESSWLYGTLYGIKSIMVADKKDFFYEKFSNCAVKIGDIKKKDDTLGALPKIMIEMFSISGVLLVAIIMVMLGYKLSTLVPIMAAFAVAAIKLLPSISSISSSMNNMVFMSPALNSVIEILDSDKTKDNYCNNDDVNEITFNKQIVFDDVSFKYQNSEKTILKNVNFTINSGESIGIVGNSGSGKTTTVDLLLGLLIPSDGKILVDNVEINKNVSSWLKNLSYIPQNIYLVDSTIRENVAFGMDESDISDEKVWDALKEAQLYDFVKELPDGIYSSVGERGTKISGGQIQRLGIARALYNNPKLLVFDEATSSLDNDTEKAIMESINYLKGKKTLIIIAHRLTTIEQCDRVYRVEDGKVILER